MAIGTGDEWRAADRLRGVWPVIGFWMHDQPVLGICGEVEWRERAWCTYVVLPHPGTSEQ